MSVLQELNDAISKGTPESRLKALWHATDMLILGRYTESEIWIFGEVIGRLSDEIELAARSQLAKRLARSDKAPVYIINKLAFDDSIDVAGPILRYSERLSNQALVAKLEKSAASYRNLAAKVDRRAGHRRTRNKRRPGSRELCRRQCRRTFLRFGLSASDQALRE
jgi:uncharacterized protein (DUF2336 family)